jgi:maltose O-acetyltransferase
LLRSIYQKVNLKLHPEKIVAYYRAKGVKIGSNVILIKPLIDEGHGFLISIGDNTVITNATIFAHDGSYSKYFGYSKVGKTEIGKNCYIGYQSVIMPGVSIGDNCIIGACAVVTKDIPNDVVVAGNPAKVIMTFDQYINKGKVLLKELPVYNTYHPFKTEEEKQAMCHELAKTTIGFDI